MSLKLPNEPEAEAQPPKPDLESPQVPASPRKRAKAAAFDREAYHRDYMREYMRKRRATGKA